MMLTALLLQGAVSDYQVSFANPQLKGRSLVGSWQGVISGPWGSLRVVFNIKENAEHGYSATLDSPDQGAFGIAADSVIVRDTLIRIPIKSIAGAFDGIHPAGADSMTGTWSQGGGRFSLVLKYSLKEAEPPKRPQEPKNPYPYKDEEITFRNADAGITLAGTFTYPISGGPFPAVILISGSGPQDRDETVFAHRPFLVLSDYLTRRGIAVLRFDDRGIGKSTGQFRRATSVDFAADVKAACAYLKTRKEVLADRIGLIGHSEGAIIAPMIAADMGTVAFIVMMAGTGVPGENIIHEQASLIELAMGQTQEEVKRAEDIRRKIFALVESGRDSAAIAPELRELLLLSADTTARKDTLSTNAAINAQIAQFTSPWLRYFLTYDPRPTLKKVRCPVLAIAGEKDLQVPPKQNLPEIEAALHAGGNSDITVRELPGLNHLFQSATKGTPDEYGKIEETISPTALKMIGDWILEKCK
jgi:pimeloyl-ACP methyl ester carboxylesterase